MAIPPTLEAIMMITVSVTFCWEVDAPSGTLEAVDEGEAPPTVSVCVWSLGNGVLAPAFPRFGGDKAKVGANVAEVWLEVDIEEDEAVLDSEVEAVFYPDALVSAILDKQKKDYRS